MMTPMRYVLLVLGIIISLHYILSFSHEEYGKATSLARLSETFRGSGSVPPYQHGVPEEYYRHNPLPSPQDRKAKAAIVALVRNSDLKGITSSMKQMEDRFNWKFRYPYVFLNDQPFSEEFKRRISGLTDSTVEFGLVPREHWIQPDWIDEPKAAASREAMIKDKVVYGGSVSYRNMCRYNSAFFYRHELLKNYRYYWRMEPDVSYFCDLDYDPFLFMQDHNKTYGFTVSLYEYERTIPTLWSAVKEFIAANPELLSPDNAMSFFSDDGGDTFNRCHFWSNFEIGDLDFWRGEAYSKFVDFLDKKGGFYYERWGDAPIHSIGAGLFARKDQLHFFSDIGYLHVPITHCPEGAANKRGKCWCDPKENFDRHPFSCLNRYDAMFR